jgi:hypothetical protein
MSENTPHHTQKEKVQHISDSGEGIADGILGCTGHSSPVIPGQMTKNKYRLLVHNTAAHEGYYPDETPVSLTERVILLYNNAHANIAGARMWPTKSCIYCAAIYLHP